MKEFSFQKIVVRSLLVFSDQSRFVIAYLGLLVSLLLNLLFEGVAIFLDPLSQNLFLFAPFFLTLGPSVIALVLVARSYAAERSKTAFHILATLELYGAYRLVRDALLMGIVFFFGVWILIGAFILLTKIPYLGAVIGFFFQVVPFVIFSMLVLFAVAIPLAIFLLLPYFSFEATEISSIRERQSALFLKHGLAFLGCAFLALTPCVVIYGGLLLASHLVFTNGASLFTLLFRAFMMAAYLAPALLFLGSMSVESYLAITAPKEKEGSSESDSEPLH